jgi:hypothetical protein
MRRHNLDGFRPGSLKRLGRLVPDGEICGCRFSSRSSDLGVEGSIESR